MGEKAEYRSAIRSRRLIRQAFVDLMKEKDIEKIKVTDIIKRADINRGTFYAHYQDTRAVIEQIENEIIGKILEILDESQHRSFFRNPLPLLLEISKYLEKDPEYYRILINSKGSKLFLEKIKNIFVKCIENDSDISENIKKSPEFFIRINFYAGGITNLYQIWFSGEMDCSFDEVSLEISKMIISNSTFFYE